MNIITITKSRLVTKTQPIAGAKFGLEVLNEFFRHLGEKLKTSSSEQHTTELALLKASIGDAIHLAYKNWKAFSEKYSCSIGYSESIDKSNVFKLTLVENDNGFDREFIFRF